MLGFDPLYLLFVAPAFLLSVVASLLTRSRFQHYAQVPAARGLTGAEVARFLLGRGGVHGVQVQEHEGFLSDHYDPTRRVVNLSPAVYHGRSISSIAVAAHETGHALQHAQLYWPLKVRTAIVPLASIGSSLSYVIILVGMVLNALSLAYAGVILFTAVVAFQLITLPVEFDASSRAKKILFDHGLVTPQERGGVAKVLSAAALTYVAAAASALLTLFYFLVRLGLLGGRNDDR
jgi:Zn-dependent membrane protease YugP